VQKVKIVRKCAFRLDSFFGSLFFVWSGATPASSFVFENHYLQFNSRLQPTQTALGTVQNATDRLKLDYGTTQNNENVLSQTITAPSVGENQGFTATQTYTYDSLNRLKSATEIISGNQTWKQTFVYDRYGNRRFDVAGTTTLGDCPAVQCNPTVDMTNNRFTSGQGYVYDLTGNLIQDAAGWQYVYDG
jgi:hypothetical protein